MPHLPLISRSSHKGPAFTTRVVNAQGAFHGGGASFTGFPCGWSRSAAGRPLRRDTWALTHAGDISFASPADGAFGVSCWVHPRLSGRRQPAPSGPHLPQRVTLRGIPPQQRAQSNAGKPHSPAQKCTAHLLCSPGATRANAALRCSNGAHRHSTASTGITQGNRLTGPGCWWPGWCLRVVRLQ